MTRTSPPPRARTAERPPREVDERVDKSMRIAEPWTCGDCHHHRRCAALIGSLSPRAAHCDFAPSRFSLDTIGVLARLLDEAGATLTLHGEPVSADELRAYARNEAENTIARAILRSTPRQETAR